MLLAEYARIDVQLVPGRAFAIEMFIIDDCCSAHGGALPHKGSDTPISTADWNRNKTQQLYDTTAFHHDAAELMAAHAASVSASHAFER